MISTTSLCSAAPWNSRRPNRSIRNFSITKNTACEFPYHLNLTAIAALPLQIGLINCTVSSTKSKAAPITKPRTQGISLTAVISDLAYFSVGSETRPRPGATRLGGFESDSISSRVEFGGAGWVLFLAKMPTRCCKTLALIIILTITVTLA
jgi:hypothetical protein